MSRRTHTLRGKLATGDVRELIIDDGMYTKGYRIVRFEIFPNDLSAGSADVSGMLVKEEDAAQQDWDASDSRQIAWSSTTMSTANAVNNKTDIIDPDHVVIRELYVTGYSSAGDVNYLVILEPITLTQDEAVLQLIKERSQDDIGA